MRKLVVNLFAPGGKKAILEVFWPEGFRAYVVPADGVVERLEEFGFVRGEGGFRWEAPMSSYNRLLGWVAQYPIAYKGEARNASTR